MRTTNSGRLGEAKVFARLVELGWYPFLDPSGKCPVDILAWKDGKTIAVQVKSTLSRKPAGHYEVQVGAVRPNRTGNTIHSFSQDSCDYLAVYLHEDDVVCFFAPELVPSRSMRIGGDSKRKIEDFINLGG